MKEIQKLISNSTTLASEHQSYAAIIGANPSRGARSPVLWNAAFSDLNIDAQMIPMDVTSDNIELLLENLEADCRFIGGAIAVPHKGSIAKILANKSIDRLSNEALAIGAVNCLYKNSQGKICATNTDGEGALQSIKTKRENLLGKNIFLIGPGGAGKAVAAYIKTAIGDSGCMTLCVRNQDSIQQFSNNLAASIVQWPPKKEDLMNIDVLVNCSSVGANIDKLFELSPLASPDNNNISNSAIVLQELKSDALVFDIIYDPDLTVLLNQAKSMQYEILNGLMMNFEQAVLAFHYAVQARFEVQNIRQSMSKIK